MKTILLISAAGLLSLGATAFAQDAKQPDVAKPEAQHHQHRGEHRAQHRGEHRHEGMQGMRDMRDMRGMREGGGCHDRS